MSGTPRRSKSPPDRPAQSESAEGGPLANTISRDLTAFGRTVTATAGHLIGPAFGEGNQPQHYNHTMSDVSKQLMARPSLQRRMLSFNNRSPTELVRSKLSTAEIQYRALTHVSDDLLRKIPEVEHSYSLFQGFQATVPEAAEESDRGGKKGKHRRKGSRNGRSKSRAIGNGDESEGPPTLHTVEKERKALTRQLEMLAIRKNLASSEIREIDMKIQNLGRMRGIVLDRLAKLEQEEQDIEHDLVGVDNKLEELADEMELATIGEDTPQATEAGSSGGEDGQSDEFMSASVYGKLHSPTTSTAGGARTKKRRNARRISMPILHEHLDPGTNLKEIHTHTDTITSLDFDVPFGTLVSAALDDSVRVWDLNTGKCLGLLEGHHASVRCLQVEDNIVATGSMDASIRLWDLSRAESYRYASSINCEDDGQSEEHTNASMGDCHIITLDSHIDEVTALYFTGDTLVSGSADKTLRQWDLTKGRCVQTLDVLWAAAQTSMDEGKWRTGGTGTAGGNGFVGALQCFDAALACGTADGMVRLWDLRSGQVHRSLVGHTGPVTALQFDDMHIVTSSLDRSIRIWDLRTGTIFDAFGYDNPVTSMQFDTRRIVSAACENVVKVYDKTDGRQWDCGAGAKEEGGDLNAAVVDRVRVKDGYLVEGRRDGVVGVWAC